MKKLFTFACITILCVSFARSEVYNGTCGANLNWSLNTADSILVITGSGDMTDFGSFYAPWKSYSRNIKAVSFPNGLTSIGSRAFYDCLNLKSVAIPSGVTSIGDEAFDMCENLASVTIPNSVTEMGSSVFASCFSLPLEGGIRYADTYLVGVVNDFTKTTYSIKNGTRWIGTRAFVGCNNLASIAIPNTVISIEETAFSTCSALASVVIPNSVVVIKDLAFNGCTALNSATVNSASVMGHDVFAGCSSLESVILGDGVLTLGKYTFRDCGNLTSIQIGNQLSKIDEFAFYQCTSLSSINMPSTLSEIGMFAFSGCTGLSSITCQAVDPPSLGLYVFFNVDKSIPLYVPNGSVPLYSHADQWEDFYNVQGLTTGLDDVVESSHLGYKVIQDGQLYIMRNDLLYDAQGKLVK